MKIRLVKTNGEILRKINEVVKTLKCPVNIEFLTKNDTEKYDIKTPTVIIENVVISGLDNLSVNDIQCVFSQFIEA